MTDIWWYLLQVCSIVSSPVYYHGCNIYFYTWWTYLLDVPDILWHTVSIVSKLNQLVYVVVELDKSGEMLDSVFLDVNTFSDCNLLRTTSFSSPINSILLQVRSSLDMHFKIYWTWNVFGSVMTAWRQQNLVHCTNISIIWKTKYIFQEV